MEELLPSSDDSTKHKPPAHPAQNLVMSKQSSSSITTVPSVPSISSVVSMSSSTSSARSSTRSRNEQKYVTYHVSGSLQTPEAVLVCPSINLDIFVLPRFNHNICRCNSPCAYITWTFIFFKTTISQLWHLIACFTNTTATTKREIWSRNHSLVSHSWGSDRKTSRKPQFLLH